MSAPLSFAAPPAGFQRLGVVGAGAWGTALAQTCARAGRDVTIWAREPAVADAINRQRANPDYLPGVDLDPAIRATTDLAGLAGCDALLLATPAQHLRAVCAGLRPHLSRPLPAVICAKGVEQGTLALMTEAAAAALGDDAPLAVLSGPTFAAEAARGQPTAVTLACADSQLGAALMAAIGSRSFRPYLTDDLIGAQLGGAVKNVLAIGCGVAVGANLGDNARAALITRGLAEITRLAVALGGRAETLTGLSGLGDLTLTCTSFQSRNMSLGAALGQGRTLADVLGERRSVAEGVHTAAAVTALAARHGVEMPISAAVDAVLNRGAGVQETIQALLARPFREEAD